MAKFTFSRLRKFQEDAQAFIEERRIAQEYSRVSAVSKFLHFWLLVGKNFIRNRCPTRAASLAYTTLLAMIPLFAVAIGVTTSLLKKEGEKSIQEVIDQLVAKVAPTLNLVPKSALDGTNAVAVDFAPGEPDDEAAATVRGSQEVARLIKGYIDNINSGTLGVTGMIALVIVAVSLLSTIEATFNDIWGVNRGRSWLARFINYWAAITLGPIILVLTMGPTLGKYLQTASQMFASMPGVGRFVLQVIPFVVPSLLFGLLYQLMPNTKVQWRAALVGGIVGGCLWQLNNQCSALYVSRVVTYSQIYGSIGMLPIFLVSLYFSWVFVLLGAQVAYAFQNQIAYLQEKQAETVSQRGREFLALRTMTCIAIAFRRGESPPTVLSMTAALGVTTRLITQVLSFLLNARLVVETTGTDPGYLPARPLGDLTCHDVLQALRAGQGHEPVTTDEPPRAVVRSKFDQILQAERDVAGNVTFQALVEEAQVLTAKALSETQPAQSLPASEPDPKGNA